MNQGLLLGEVEFASISEISVYKADMLTFDLICCNVTDGTRETAAVLWTHEEMSGFDRMMRAFERLPGFRRDWRATVVQPPFAENWTVVFRRSP